jgi:hypothetical protein
MFFGLRNYKRQINWVILLGNFLKLIGSGLFVVGLLRLNNFLDGFLRVKMNRSHTKYIKEENSAEI